MNTMKKLLFLVGITVCMINIEAAQPGKNAGFSKNKQIQKPTQSENVVSMEQIQQMQEMEQFLNALVVMVMINFFNKFPKFISSLVVAYEKDPSAVEQKVATQVQKYIKEQGDQVISSILQEVQAGDEAQAMVQHVKPVIENILAHEIVKWVHIAAMGKVKI